MAPWWPPLGGLLYPFGPAAGDEATPREDDGMSPEIQLWPPFSFYGRSHHSLYVNNNGVVSFGTGVPEFTPEPFPLPGHRPFVAPYWADVDTRLGGDVFYRQSQEPELLARLARDLTPAVTSSEPTPKPTWAFVATWYRVSFFGAASKKVNTFQAVLATDGATSFVMLNYGDLQWTTGLANDGNAYSGLGGTPAQVGTGDTGGTEGTGNTGGTEDTGGMPEQAGFNSGDDLHYYNIPGVALTRCPTPTPSPSPSPTLRRTTEERVYICGS
ncbi:sushi, nidogen and EGF-like domain-containing protein 1 [Falco naumanni]|uniref:sushi, nidogen and EGF-like domain-containing protein 1 n=1 Tax=Falco naumanni TaxID=148594 RepID=UPI001ADEB4E0|nr:sushi, nidogen and EGF-like domain-containing protein 1 [Falco naumanni]